MKIAHPVQKPKKFIFSRLWELVQIHTTSYTYKHKYKCEIQIVIDDLVCSLRCTFKSLPDSAFVITVYRESAFWTTGDFSVAVPTVATETNWKQGSPGF